MATTKAELEKSFQEKSAQLVAELEAWFAEEAESIDGVIEAGAPAGMGGSIMGMRPAIDSKRVIDATVVTKRVLGIELPPNIIRPGGYTTCDEMIADIVPKLKKVFTGESRARKRRRAGVLQAA